MGRPLTPEVLHHAKRATVDWFAALLPGAIQAPATFMMRALGEELAGGRARLALGGTAPARTAALIKGTTAHTVEVDDIHREAIYHPGAPTIAAALAVGRVFGNWSSRPNCSPGCPSGIEQVLDRSNAS